MAAAPHIHKDQLLETFDVLGHYYLLEGQNCRKLLEIRRACSERPAKADALVVMMNPGSSRPICSERSYSPRLVPAHPDDTQYQIMRVMEAWKWSLVNVINLSDLAETKSKTFCKNLKYAPEAHSIFHPSRVEELDNLLANATTFVRAWGCDGRLRKLGAAATAALSKYSKSTLILGLPGSKTDQFRHPLPPYESDRRKWLDDFLALKK